MFSKLSSSLISKRVLIKGSSAIAGGTGIGVTWWQVYDNVSPKFLNEEKGKNFVLSKSYTDLNDILRTNFTSKDGKNQEYMDSFKFNKNDCVKKYLPGNIAEAETTIDTGNRDHSSTVDVNGF